MIGIRTARMMTRYNAWSNKVWFAAIAALPPGEATKERKSLFKNMVHTLNHIYIIDVIWQAHLEGRDHGLAARNTPDHPPLDELWRKQQESDAWYVKLGDMITDAALDERRTVTLIGGNQVAMSRGEMLLHLYHHTAYHRGFIAEMLYEVPGCRPPVTDLPVFLRETPQDY
jgi:uncharacterized damage-inducible protein DinB